MGSATIILTPVTSPTPLASLGHAPQTTVYDVIEQLLSYLGAAPDQKAHGDVRRAISAAQRELPTLHPWTAFIKVGRIFLNAPYSTGTITYDHTGGAYERMMTLASGTWPTWIDRGYISIGQVKFYVDRRISDTIITLDVDINPGADIAALTTYNAIQDSYLLPEDFVAGDMGLAENNWCGMAYITPDAWLAFQRSSETTSGQPAGYTFTADPKNRGRLAIRVFPPADTAQTLDFLYHKKPKDITTFEQIAGRASVTASSNLVTLSSGGTFKALHVGSVLRLSSDAVNAPGGLEGLWPYAEERTILRVNSTTEAVVDDLWAESHAAVLYRLSDPVDLEPDSMMNVFHTACVKWLCWGRNRKELGDATAAWRMALNLAKEADRRSVATRRVNLGSGYQPRLRDNTTIALGAQE